MPRPQGSPPPRPPDWSPQKTHAALQKQFVEFQRLRGLPYRTAKDDERTCTNLTEKILAHGFGEDSANMGHFDKAKLVGQMFHARMSQGERQGNFQQRMDALAAVVKGSLSELELMGATESNTNALEAATKVRPDSRDVFVVHGHDDAVRQSVARFLEKLELHPVILHEQPNRGRTLIEKFEAHADVGFAVVLLTPDDMCGQAQHSRARQNVILELGYFIGKLGRERVCALYVEGVELPSDLHGVVYVPYDAANGWRVKLANEINAAGIAVDLNRILTV